MDVAGLANDRSARSAVAGRPHGARIPNARRSGVRPEPTRINPQPVLASPSVEAADPASEAADQLQADYFLQMLTSRRLLIERRIGEFRKAVAGSEAAGDIDGACNYRRLARIEEQDRRALDDMIDKLRHRFPRPSPADVSPLAPRARFGVH